MKRMIMITSCCMIYACCLFTGKEIMTGKQYILHESKSMTILQRKEIEVKRNIKDVPVVTSVIEETEEIEEEIEEDSIQVTEEEYELLLKLIYSEANVETYECQKKVVYVVLNRLYDSEFPDTIYDVVYQKNQFQPTRNGAIEKAQPNEVNEMALIDALQNYGKDDFPQDVMYFWNYKIKELSDNSSWFYKMHKNNYYETDGKTAFYYAR